MRSPRPLLFGVVLSALAVGAAIPAAGQPRHEPAACPPGMYWKTDVGCVEIGPRPRQEPAHESAQQDDQPAATARSVILDKYGPPLKIEHLEGDEFWYYVVQEQNSLQEAGNILQGFAAGIQGRSYAPAPAPTQTVIFRFDGRTGALKAHYVR